MKKAALAICLFVLTATNMFSQQTGENPTIKIDTGYIIVDGGKLYYEASGVGENIVLIHDGIVHHVIWDGQFLEFAKNYHVVRYDRRGYGKSPNPQNVFSNVEDLIQLFVQQKIEKATVFGMSAGGDLAIDFTLKYPEMVSSLVLVGAVVGGFPYTSHMTGRGGHFDFRNPKYAELKNFIQYFGWEDPYEVYSENIKAKETLLKVLQTNPQNADGGKYRFEKQPERPAVKFLSEIKVPTLIVVGEFDIPDVHFHAGAIASGISNAKIEVISKAGHLVPFEQPEKFNETVLRFLKRNEFHGILNSQRVNAAVQYFTALQKLEPKTVLFEEAEMNALGYQYMQQGKVKEAIELFKLNVIAFPNSGNVYDSQAEAYLNDGQNDLAITYYEKAVALNPNNLAAKVFLAAMQKFKKQKSSGKNLLNKPESMIYDKVHKRYLFSNYGSGNIIQVDNKGKQSILVENKKAIQGLEIVGNVVYVGAQNSIRGFDLETGDIVMDVAVEGVSNLNDVTADDKGNLYAGDVFGTKIIKINIKDKSYSVFVDGKGIDHPNGIFFDKLSNRIFVCSFRNNFPIQAINLADASVTTLASTNLNNGDGIVLDKYGRCYVTSWETKSIYRFDKDFSEPPRIFYTNTCAPADISYDSVHDAIAIPLMLYNCYEIVPVDPPKGKN